MHLKVVRLNKPFIQRRSTQQHTLGKVVIDIKM